MGYDYDTICIKCNAKLHISETKAEYEGGKDKEQAICPKCKNIVAEHMVNGFLEVALKQ